MKAVVVQEKGRLEIQEIPAPTPGDYEALVKVEECGICNSTDHKLIEGTMFWAPPFPIVLGHESVGRVVEVGSKVRKFKVGDRVTRPVSARDSQAVPRPAAGGFAEYGLVVDGPAKAADGDSSLLEDYGALRQNVVPDFLSPAEAVLNIVLAETASVMLTVPSVRNKTIVVAGTGLVGITFGLWSKMAGARVITLGRRAERLDLARRHGADATVNTSDEGYIGQIRDAADGKIDGIFEATGCEPLAAEIETLLDSDSFACAYGVPPTGVNYSIRWTTPDVDEHLCYNWCADLLQRGWVQSQDFITHRWSLEQAGEAFQQVERGEVLKGIIQMTRAS